MVRQRVFVFFATALACSAQAFGQKARDSEKLFSPSSAQSFYEIAHGLYTSSSADSPDARQAEVFFNAVTDLDERADYVLADIIKFASRYPDRDYSAVIQSALVKYLDKDSNLLVAKLAVQYLVERLNSVEERQELLRKLMKNLGDKNPAFGSEVATELALLVSEKANYRAAVELLALAYMANPHNKLAFAQLNELTGEALDPAFYAGHLRWAMSGNPLDIEAALAFARYMESVGLYEVAAEAYEYCAKLSHYLYPGEPLPASIYLPWAMSYYNIQHNRHKCLQIAESIRQSGRFDVLLEAIAGRAALETGEKAEAERIFKTIESVAVEKLGKESVSGEYRPEQFAWLYCFAYPDAEKSLQWANKAYAMEPNSETVTAILAYSLGMNQHIELSEPFVAQSYQSNQIAALTKGLIQLSRQEKDAAIETLKSAIAMDSGSLEAHQAKRLLRENGSDYIPETDPGIVLGALTETFEKTIVPEFVPAEKMLSIKLATLGGTELNYGSKLSANLVIINNWSEPFVIGEGGLVSGEVRVDAEISGDVNIKIPNLLSKRFVPSSPAEPGEFIFIPLQLARSRFKETLRKFPQASLEIKLTGYLDPVVAADGTVRNGLADVKPTELVIRRRPVRLSNRYLQSRLESMARGKQGQKLVSAKLFSGLLLEQDAMSKGEPLYKFMYAEPSLLKSGLVRSLADEDWTVRLQTLVSLMEVPLDYELTRALAANLNDENWPVRMMSLFLLGKSQGASFGKVLDWTAKYDVNRHVREMSIALGGAEPEEEREQRGPGGAEPNNFSSKAAK